MTKIEKLERRIHWSECVHLALMTLLLAFPLILTFQSDDRTTQILLALGTVIPVQLIRFLCERIKRKSLRLLSGLAVIGLSVLLTWSRERWSVYLICCVPILISGGFLPRSKGRILLTVPSPWAAAALVVAYGYGRSVETLGVPLIANIVLVLTALMVMNYFIHTSQTKLLTDIRMAGDTEISVSGMIRQNRKTLLAFLLIGVLILTALPFLQIQRQEGNLIEAHIERKKLLIADRQRFPGAVVRFFLCAPHSFAAESVFRSSAGEHWAELVRRAEERGLFLDETGLYKGKKEIPLSKEEDLYRELGLPNLPAEVRDGLFEFTMGPGAPDLLIRRPQIRGDLHMHTLFSDGSGSIEEMADKSLSNGMEYIAVTDHSKRVSVANGMDEHRALIYWRTVDEINQRIREARIPSTILKGIEVDVLENAELDFNDEILSQADWVMASLHYHRSQPREQIHRRIEAAMRCPYVSAISHPTGKEWMSDFRIDMDFDYVLELAKKYDKCLEMNSQLHRFDLDWRLCRRAKEHGVKIVISTDSHSPSDLDYMRYGVQLARKAGLTADDILNTLPLEEIMKRRSAPLPLTQVY